MNTIAALIWFGMMFIGFVVVLGIVNWLVLRNLEQR